MLSLFSNLITAITGGTTNIFLKLISMLGIGIFWRWFKGVEAKEQQRQQEAKLDSDINQSNTEAGKNASIAKEGSDINEEYLKQKRMINEMKLKARVQIITPEEIKTGVAFDAQFTGLPSGTEVMMDDKWRMGKINPHGYLKMILNTPGKRKLTVKIGEHKFEKEIEVK